MKKDTMREIVGLAILLVLYCLVVFLVPFAHTTVFWISFGFTLVAFFVTAVTLYSAVVKHSDAKSKFYGFPIAKIGVVYGIAQTVVSLLFMALGQWLLVWVAILVYAIGLGATLLGLIGMDAMVDQIHAQDQKLKKDVTRMRALQSRLNQMASLCDVPELKQLADDIRYSDPVSSPALVQVENDLAAAVNDLESAVVENDSAIVAPLCRKASAILAERNRLCKLNKI